MKLIKSKGKIIINGKNISLINNSEILDLRKEIQIVFQDPFSSLSPRMNIEGIISEGLNIHFPRLSKIEKKNKIVDTLNKVG